MRLTSAVALAFLLGGTAFAEPPSPPSSPPAAQPDVDQQALGAQILAMLQTEIGLRGQLITLQNEIAALKATPPAPAASSK